MEKLVECTKCHHTFKIETKASYLVKARCPFCNKENIVVPKSKDQGTVVYKMEIWDKDK